MQFKKNTLISVIVNCHNGERFINKCILSILDQSYKNLEIIFWDNNSTDNTFKIIKEFKDKRIKYFKSKKYIKLYEARNLALKKTKGEYIAFLDIDDTWEKHKLSKQLKKMLKTKSDVCFTNHWIFNKRKNLFKKEVNSKKILNQILTDYPISILTVMIKSKILKKKNLLFDKRYEIIGDFDLFYRLSFYAKFCCINKPLATYFIHGDNLSIKKVYKEVLEFDFWIKKNKKILKNYDNTIIEKNNMRRCNYLVSKNKLSIFSKEIKLIKNKKIKFKIFIKIILKKLYLI
jgi:glycosyltransferase involved in cell wall biosynthesis